MTNTLNTETLRVAKVRLGERIRTLRKAQQLSLPDLAARSKIHVSHVSKIERGGANPTLQTISAIAAGLGTSLSDLFTGIAFPVLPVM